MEQTRTNAQSLGWPLGTQGELDHQRLAPPYVRLSSFRRGIHGDVIYVFDLRMTQPNATFMSTRQLHSLEHLLLSGFKKYLPDSFVGVAPMGCQTGFYLTTLNEGGAAAICKAYADILNDILNADDVPYANPHECGHGDHHSINESKEMAQKVLEARSEWLSVLA